MEEGTHPGFDKKVVRPLARGLTTKKEKRKQTPGGGERLAFQSLAPHPNPELTPSITHFPCEGRQFTPPPTRGRHRLPRWATSGCTFSPAIWSSASLVTSRPLAISSAGSSDITARTYNRGQKQEDKNQNC